MPELFEFFKSTMQVCFPHLLHELVVGGLIEEDEVVELVPRLALGPLLLLGLAAARALLLLRRLRRGGLRTLGVLFRTLKTTLSHINLGPNSTLLILQFVA